MDLKKAGIIAQPIVGIRTAPERRQVAGLPPALALFMGSDRFGRNSSAKR